MPIVKVVHRVLFDRQPARRAVAEVMTRGLRIGARLMAPTRHAPRGPRSEPVQEFFSIGEVCDLT